jgi:23S rRNA (pseudouridine1915-N3)-methyltransferase
MRVTILSVGRLSADYKRVCDHYLGLLRPYGTMDLLEVPDVPISQGSARVLRTEGDALLKRLRPGAFTIVLDRTGRQMTSEALSSLMAERKLYGQSDFLFILGGALGLDERVRHAADMVWSLSRLTFPHQMARCIVLEQVYRAIRIERGEPYHH